MEKITDTHSPNSLTSLLFSKFKKGKLQAASHLITNSEGKINKLSKIAFTNSYQDMLPFT